MKTTLFDQYIVSGGWAMFFLVPASVVAIATALQVLLTVRKSHPQSDSDNADPQALPLLWIYAASPVVGAAGSTTKLLFPGGSSEPTVDSTTILLPFAWGLAIGIFALVVYMIASLRAGSNSVRKLLYTGPGLLALVAAAVLAAVVSERSSTDSTRDTPVLTMRSLTPSTASAADTPRLTISASGYLINQQPVSDADIVFRLSGLAARSDAIIVETAPDLPAAKLADALTLVNQAGFLHVGIDTPE